MKKIFVVLSLLFAVVIAILLFFNTSPIANLFWKRNVNPQKSQIKGCNKMCMTKDCVLTANEVIESMDKTVDPCVDFYQHACGNYIKTTHPINGEYETVFLVKTKNMITKASKLISNMPNNPTSKLYRNMKTFHQNCMDFTASELSFISGVRKILSKFYLEDWPNLPRSKIRSLNVIDGIASHFLAFRQYGFIDIFNYERKTNINETDDYWIEVSIHISDLMLTPAQHNDSNVKADFKNMVGVVLSFFDFKDNIEDASEKVREVEEILYSFIQATDNEEETSGDLKKQWFPAHDSSWSSFLKTFFQIRGYDIDMKKIRVVGTNHQVLETFRRLLQSLPPRALVNYLALRLITKNIKHANYVLKETLNKNSALKLGRQRFRTRAWYCMPIILHLFRLPVSLAFADAFVQHKTVSRLTRVYRSLRNVSMDFLRNIKAFNDSMKENMVEDLSKILGPDEQLNNVCTGEDLRELEGDFEFTSQELIHNLIEQEAHQEKLTMMMATGNLSPQSCQVVTPNMPMHTTSSKISLGLGVLSFPLLSASRPMVFDIGKLGAGLAHEIGHVVQKTIKSFHDSEQVQALEAKSRNCLTDQYSKFKWQFIDEEFKADETQDENEADNFGLQIISTWFHNLSDQDKSEARVLGLDATAPEAYFLDHAQMWCEVLTLEGERYMHENDVHSPGRFRILGSFMNSIPFSQTFSCPIGSPMNPTSKCELWQA